MKIEYTRYTWWCYV